MNLEDHLGDIVRKARLHSGVSPDGAAAAAGLAPDAFARLEETGTAPAGLNLTALATTVGLHPDKLRGIAAGWTPAPVDLGLWRELRVVTTASSGMGVNAYLLWDEVTREAALFDTGFEADPIVALVQENDLQLRHLFITHGHVDHVVAMPALQARFPKLRIHSNMRSAPVDQRNRAQECVSLGSLRIMHRETLGHAEDGVTYIVGNWPEDAPHVAIVGDAIFAGSMGKAPSNAALAARLVREAILSLPPATLLCPGHGPLTTVAEEKTHNPFF